MSHQIVFSAALTMVGMIEHCAEGSRGFGLSGKIQFYEKYIDNAVYTVYVCRFFVWEFTMCIFTSPEVSLSP